MASTAGDRGKSCDSRTTEVMLVGAGAGIRCSFYGTQSMEHHIGSRSRRGSQVQRRAAFGSNTGVLFAPRRLQVMRIIVIAAEACSATISQRVRAPNANARPFVARARHGGIGLAFTIRTALVAGSAFTFAPESLDSFPIMR